MKAMISVAFMIAFAAHTALADGESAYVCHYRSGPKICWKGGPYMADCDFDSDDAFSLKFDDQSAQFAYVGETKAGSYPVYDFAFDGSYQPASGSRVRYRFQPRPDIHIDLMLGVAFLNGAERGRLTIAYHVPDGYFPQTFDCVSQN